MTATYTAKWDGSTFTDGKIAATLHGGTNSLIWTGTASATPVLPTPLLENSYLNWYPGQLTGYARFGSQSSFLKANETQIEDFRVGNEPPMSAGESRVFTLRRYVLAPDYDKGAHYPNFSVVAAIYADGMTFGDAHVLKVMLEKRKEMLASLNAIGPILCSMGQRGASIHDISEALNQQQATEKARSTTITDAPGQAYQYVQKSLGSRVNSHLPLNRAIKRTWDDFNTLRSGLSADPVKNADGTPAIPVTTPLSCSLP